jgi:indolepyruvate decarboxylase
VKHLFRELDGFITEDMVIISDIGDCLFGAVDLKIRKRTEFISPAYYTSMGFGVPASIGAQLANPRLRPLVIVGDGAFQMTGLELSTTVRLGLNPIVIVMNNRGYSTERHIKDGPFNDIGLWWFSRVPELLGDGRGFEVETQADLEWALKAALSNEESFSIINVHLDKYDKSPALDRLAVRLAARMKGRDKATK